MTTVKTNRRFLRFIENQCLFLFSLKHFFTLEFMSDSYATSLVSPYVACGFLFGGRVHGWYIARVRHDNSQETRVVRATKSSTFQLGHVLASAIVLYADDNKRSITGVTFARNRDKTLKVIIAVRVIACSRRRLGIMRGVFM